jgi:hypothetical protein
MDGSIVDGFEHNHPANIETGGILVILTRS